MILKIWDNFPQQEGWLYVDHVLSAKVESSTYVLTKNSAEEGDGSPRHVHDNEKNIHYRLGIHATIEEDQKRNSGGSSKVWVPNRNVEFHGGILLCDWRYLIQDYEADSDDHIGVKLILLVFDRPSNPDGKESQTYLILKGQEAYLMSDTGKTIERI